METRDFDRRHFLKLCGASLIGALGIGSVGVAARTLAGEGIDKAYGNPIHSLDAVPEKENLLARIAIASDLHVGYGREDDVSSTVLPAGAKVATKKILNAFKTIGDIAPDTDAFIFVGDMVVINDQAERTELLENVLPRLGDYFDETPEMHIVMGNHDCQNYSTTEFEADYGKALGKIYDPDFTSAELAYTDFGQKQNTLTSIAGVPLIKLAPLNTDNTGWAGNRCEYSYLYSFLKNALAKAAKSAPGLPIIIASHYGFEGSEINKQWYGEYGSGKGSIPELLKNYPQVIFFSGHIHNDLADNDYISDNLGFTCVSTSTLGSCLEENEGQGTTDDSQGLFVEVYNTGRTIIHGLDFAKNIELKPNIIEPPTA